MNQLVFFLEELSAQAFLESFLPRVLPDHVTPKYIVFRGKQDLEKQLVQRLRGYQYPGAKFIVLRDKDSEDCLRLKNRLVEMCRQARQSQATVRIACHELESWYLADLQAVETGLQRSGLAKLQTKFDKCDRLASPARHLTEIAPTYEKVGGSRLIGKYLDLDNRRSPSFYHFVQAIRKLTLCWPEITSI